MTPEAAQQRALWLEQARIGMLRALATHRRRLQGEEPLTIEHRAGLVDCLLAMEEYITLTWAPDMVALTKMNSPRQG